MIFALYMIYKGICIAYSYVLHHASSHAKYSDTVDKIDQYDDHDFAVRSLFGPKYRHFGHFCPIFGHFWPNFQALELQIPLI